MISLSYGTPLIFFAHSRARKIFFLLLILLCSSYSLPTFLTLPLFLIYNKSFSSDYLLHNRQNAFRCWYVSPVASFLGALCLAPFRPVLLGYEPPNPAVSLSH